MPSSIRIEDDWFYFSVAVAHGDATSRRTDVIIVRWQVRARWLAEDYSSPEPRVPLTRPLDISPRPFAEHFLKNFRCMKPFILFSPLGKVAGRAIYFFFGGGGWLQSQNRILVQSNVQICTFQDHDPNRIILQWCISMTSVREDVAYFYIFTARQLC